MLKLHWGILAVLYRYKKIFSYYKCERKTPKKQYEKQHK